MASCVDHSAGRDSRSMQCANTFRTENMRRTAHVANCSDSTNKRASSQHSRTSRIESRMVGVDEKNGSRKEDDEGENNVDEDAVEEETPRASSDQSEAAAKKRRQIGWSASKDGVAEDWKASGGR